MSAQAQQYYPAPKPLNQVQSVMRLLVWVGTFVLVAAVVGAVGVAIGLLGGLISTGLGASCAGAWGLLALLLVLAIPTMVSRCLYVVPEYQRVVVLKMGQFIGVKGPGMFWVIPYPPYYQSAAMTLDMRIRTHVIQAAETLTRDNVPVGCEAVVFWRVENPRIAALEVQNHAQAVYMAANSALKDTIGTLELSELLSRRELVAQNLKMIIDQAAEKFGVEVSSVEITDVHVPADLIQELSVRAQAERAAQAKIAEAKAELQVARQFQLAAETMGPKAMEIYRLNVLERIGREEGSQIVVYGLGGNSQVGAQIAAAVAGAQTVHQQAAEQ